MEIIKSEANNYFKKVKSLKAKKYRYQQGKFLIEGWKLIGEAVKADRAVEAIFINEKYLEENLTQYRKLSKDSGIRGLQLPENLFKQLVATETPQGVVAVVRMEETKDQEISDHQFVLVLDQIQDPGNLGTIIRTADAVGIKVIYLTKGCADLYNEKVIRATMGSIFHLQLGLIEDNSHFVDRLKAANFNLAVAHVGGSSNIFRTKLKYPVALVLGNEAHGPGEVFLRAATNLIQIPIMGEAESLNVGIAAGISMYEILRQNKFDLV